jgi:hypothetical protein
MSSIPKRARSVARIAVGLVALGATFLAVSPAQGAIGTANQVTTRLPDLRTATYQSLFNEEEVCFDQTIDLAVPAPGAGTVQAGGYISISLIGGTAPVLSQDKCIKSQYSTTDVDLAAATFVHVDANVVKLHNAAGNNIADSAPNIGATTHNGTRGNSTSPDLALIAPNEAQNQLGFVFDQQIRTTGAACGALGADPDFAFYDSQGLSHTDGTLISCSNTSSGQGAALVQFPVGTSPIGSAQRAWVNPGQVLAKAPAVTANLLFSVQVPVSGSNGHSNDPDLENVNIVSPSGNQLDFVYDENIANATANKFHVTFSDGNNATGLVNGNTVAIINGNTARVTFTNLDTVTEFIVGGYADGPGSAGAPPAVQGADDNAPAPPNGLPAGGNAGAFALGYSTGPDPLSASVNQSGGQITVLEDQRFVTGGATAQLVDNNGLTGVFCTSTAIGFLSGPGQQNLGLQCPQSDLANAVGVYLPFGVMISTLGYTNVGQVIGIR